MREWLVIESTRSHGVFAAPDLKRVQGYIPRDVAERVLGKELGGGRCAWFTQEESDLLRQQPEWTTEELVPGDCPSCGRPATSDIAKWCGEDPCAVRAMERKAQP